ncbi:hypothetical protein Misp01_55130 [Microtetraspora sp. NBRC 13810]|uniref:glycosyltransferase n=1 Tax=Microtetraspora sp. NBRC 13810 TaxID=3030990 RepID=UPI0024A3D07A|nr:glycosyltransferase [Microtetraspora sp. NBRC 13810]GLW10385.1 hypothetical protein Misp01_55130 [Microtetraspora sp. NBRC 13810]
MRICAIVKYPPIQGGISALSYWTVHGLAQAGHQVTVVTNAEEVEDDFRMLLTAADRALLEADYPGGGAVRLAATRRPAPAHVPYSPLYVTKLAALATDEIRRGGCDLIYAHYLEPYGLAAHLASSWTGVPHVLRHAGSDRVRLLGEPELSAAYREILRRADAVAGQPCSVSGFGAVAEPVAPRAGRFVPSCWQTAARLDVNTLIAGLAEHPWVTNTAPLPAGPPVIAVYGKLGETKGSFDLLAALAEVHDAGRRFSLLVMGGGWRREAFAEAVERHGLGPVTWTLPFLPHWRVPGFLRRADAVCVLERDFPVAAHMPALPAEVLAAGTCLIVSEEVAAKQRPALRDGVNALVVADPRDTAALAAVVTRVLDDLQAARRIGAAGRQSLGTYGERELGEATAALLSRVLSRRPAPGGAALLTEHMPATTRLACEVDPPVVTADPQDVYQAACELVTWIDKRRDELPCGAAEIARYERDRLWLRLDLEAAGGERMFPRRPAGGHPVRSGLLRLREYRSDIDAAAADLSYGIPVRPHPGTADRFLFHKLPNLLGQVVRINSATARLIESCDGRTPLTVIATALRADLDVVTDMARDLARQRVIDM